MASPPKTPSSIEDIFDSTLHLESTHFQSGYTTGYTDGLISGSLESKPLGLTHGFQIGEELGFYNGCITVWNSALRIDPNCFSSRIQKYIKQMDELCKKYPVLDPEDESVQEIMDGLRLKFRAVSATLGLKLEYVGYPKGKGASSSGSGESSFDF